MSLESPKQKDNYNLIETNGYKIYIKEGLNGKNDTLTLKYKKVLFIGKLVVEGLAF